MRVNSERITRLFVREDDSDTVVAILEESVAGLGVVQIYDPATGTTRRPRLGESAPIINRVRAHVGLEG